MQKCYRLQAHVSQLHTKSITKKMLEPLVGKLNDLRIVLATSSEQRINLLRRTKLKFEVCPSNFDENLNPGEHTFSDFVEKTALGKAKDVWERLKNEHKIPNIVIGFDTMVAYNGKMYGKPKSAEDAIKTITDLTQSYMPHSVYTGVVLIHNGDAKKIFTEVTTVYMLKLSAEEIVSYVDTGEPMGKAGSYAIQGIAGSFVKRIEGDATNVIGLPLCRLSEELKQLLTNN